MSLTELRTNIKLLEVTLAELITLTNHNHNLAIKQIQHFRQVLNKAKHRYHLARKQHEFNSLHNPPN